MTLNFPDPSVVQTHTDAGITWTWNDTLKVWSTDLAQGGGGFEEPVTFTQVTTHEGGVSVTGGSTSVAYPGVFSNGTNIILNSAGSAAQIKRENNLIANLGGLSNSNNGTSTGINVQSNIKDINTTPGSDVIYYAGNADGTDWSTKGGVYGYQFLFPRYDGASQDPATEIVGFQARPVQTDREKDTAITYYGFKSNLSQSQNYNFYAEGSAPNYFAGESYFGSDPSAPANWYIGASRIKVRTSGKDVTQSAIEIESFNSTSNASKRAINFTKIDKDNMGAGGSLAGYIEITGGTGGSSGLIYTCGAQSKDTGFISTSDYRLKENIVDLPPSTELVKQLKPKSFNYIGNSETVQGFVAHELQEVNPSYATGTKDAVEPIGTLLDWDGTELETEVTEPDELEYTEEVETDGVTTMVTRTRTWTATGTRPVYQGVDQTKLIPLLTKALQEALERIEVLEAAAAKS